jgi:hypothetical protein
VKVPLRGSRGGFVLALLTAGLLTSCVADTRTRASHPPPHRGTVRLLASSPTPSDDGTRVTCRTWYRVSDTHAPTSGPVIRLAPNHSGKFAYRDITVKFSLESNDDEPLGLFATARTGTGDVTTLYQCVDKHIDNTFADTKQGFTGSVVVHGEAGPTGPEIQYICSGRN